MDFKTQTKPREQILALIVVLALLLFFMRVIYFPRRIAQAQWKTKLHNLELEKQALEKFTQALLKQLPQVKKETPRSPKLRILQGELAPYAEETSLLLAQWSSPQFLRGVKIQKMSDLPAQKHTGYLTSNFLLDVLGPFRQVENFLQRVEQFPALVTIDNITLQALDAKASQVELELNGTMFHLEARHEG